MKKAQRQRQEITEIMTDHLARSFVEMLEGKRQRIERRPYRIPFRVVSGKEAEATLRRRGKPKESVV